MNINNFIPFNKLHPNDSLHLVITIGLFLLLAAAVVIENFLKGGA